MLAGRRTACRLSDAGLDALSMSENNPERDLTDRKFYRAGEESRFAEEAPDRTPQTEHPAYKLAFRDTDFLLRDELRPVRFQLELLKPEMLLDEARVGSTLVMYGSARIPAPEDVEAKLEEAKGKSEYEQLVAQRLADKAKYYGEAYKLSRMVSEKAIIEDGKRQFVVVTGGGPSIMEAGNPYVTPYRSLNFHYFALRKMHFLLRARAVAVFPGGFGTFDEMFELLTLVQTGKMKPLPILLFGREVWERIIDFEAFAEEGTISKKDLDLFQWCETAEQAWEHIAQFYELDR